MAILTKLSSPLKMALKIEGPLCKNVQKMCPWNLLWYVMHAIHSGHTLIGNVLRSTLKSGFRNKNLIKFRTMLRLDAMVSLIHP